MLKPASFQCLKLQPHLPQARFKSLWSKLMNDRCKIGDDEVKSRNVVAGRLRRCRHLVGKIHFQSPVVRDNSTVEAPTGRVAPMPSPGREALFAGVC